MSDDSDLLLRADLGQLYVLVLDSLPSTVSSAAKLCLGGLHQACVYVHNMDTLKQT